MVAVCVGVAVGVRVAVRVGVAVRTDVTVEISVGVKVLPASKLHTVAPLPAHGEFAGTLQSERSKGSAYTSPGSGLRLLAFQ